ETGATPGANGIGDGTWSATDLRWNSDPTGGDGGGTGTITGWTAGDNAVFAAGSDLGTDLTSAGAFVTVTTPQSARRVTFEESPPALGGGTVDSALFTVKSGAEVNYDSILRIGTTAGKITLQGGKLTNVNFGHAGSFARNSETLEIDGTATLNYPDASF